MWVGCPALGRQPLPQGRHPPLCRHPPGQTPPPANIPWADIPQRRSLQRMVRILLERILVSFKMWTNKFLIKSQVALRKLQMGKIPRMILMKKLLNQWFWVTLLLEMSRFQHHLVESLYVNMRSGGSRISQKGVPTPKVMTSFRCDAKFLKPSWR